MTIHGSKTRQKVISPRHAETRVINKIINLCFRELTSEKKKIEVRLKAIASSRRQQYRDQQPNSANGRERLGQIYSAMAKLHAELKDCDDKTWS